MSRMKKGIGLLAGAALASLSFGMIIQAEQLEGDIVLATMNTGEVGEATEEIIDAFMEENPEVNVEIQVNTTDYENLMKAKMAANDSIRISIHMDGPYFVTVNIYILSQMKRGQKICQIH